MTDATVGAMLLSLFGDYINFVFEFSGALLTWANCWKIHKDKGYAGVYPPAIVVFAAWGFWNLVYYPSLGQWMSFYASCLLVAANCTWFLLMSYHGPLNRSSD